MAALLVLNHHYFAQLYPFLVSTAQGVWFFFVLSGFLITNGLLADNGNKTRQIYDFYLRRVCRIFPLYYFVVLVGLAFDIPGFRSSTLWIVTYSVNIELFHDQGWIGYISHFWTLAVEEQFYLLWPLIMFVMPNHRMTACFVLIGTCFLFKISFFSHSGSTYFYALSLPGSMDSLLFGSLLSIICRSGDILKLERTLRALLIVGVPGCILTGIWSYLPISLFWQVVIGGSLAWPLFAWLIVRAAADGPSGDSWGGLIMPKLGRLSYGIYIWHAVLLWPVSELEGHGYNNWAVRVLFAFVTVALAWLTSRLIEVPCVQIGRRLTQHSSV